MDGVIAEPYRPDTRYGNGPTSARGQPLNPSISSKKGTSLFVTCIVYNAGCEEVAGRVITSLLVSLPDATYLEFVGVRFFPRL